MIVQNEGESPVESDPSDIAANDPEYTELSKIGDRMRRRKKAKIYHKRMRDKTGEPGKPPKTKLPFDAVENVISDPDLENTENALLFDVMYDTASAMLGRPARPMTKTVHDVTYLIFV